MAMMMPHEAFTCPCGFGDVVLRESYRAKSRGKLYYACLKSKPRKNYHGCDFFMERRTSPSTNQFSRSFIYSKFFSRNFINSSFFSNTLHAPNYYGGSSSNTECSNYKYLLGRIKVLQATLEMYMHPEQHTLDSTTLLMILKMTWKNWFGKDCDLEGNLYASFGLTVMAIPMY
uniref:Zinc finger GRF-type domain-containing protein n=1 Tax=Tanacetum cinerariifolium TaxID=118510 RepID=A0A6L2LM10_TANCI|nr:hypothetical protein [Tanacetum cinerariifolium]